MSFCHHIAFAIRRPSVVRPLTFYILIFLRTTETFACWNDTQIKLVKYLHLDEVVRRTLIGVIAPEMSNFAFFAIISKTIIDKEKTIAQRWSM